MKQILDFRQAACIFVTDRLQLSFLLVIQKGGFNYFHGVAVKSFETYHRSTRNNLFERYVCQNPTFPISPHLVSKNDGVCRQNKTFGYTLRSRFSLPNYSSILPFSLSYFEQLSLIDVCVNY